MTSPQEIKIFNARIVLENRESAFVNAGRSDANDEKIARAELRMLDARKSLLEARKEAGL